MGAANPSRQPGTGWSFAVEWWLRGCLCRCCAGLSALRTGRP